MTEANNNDNVFVTVNFFPRVALKDFEIEWGGGIFNCRDRCDWAVCCTDIRDGDGQPCLKCKLDSKVGTKCTLTWLGVPCLGRKPIPPQEPVFQNVIVSEVQSCTKALSMISTPTLYRFINSRSLYL